MSTLHSGWHNERISLLGTLGTPQFVVLGLGLLPALFFLQAQAWILFAVALLSWLLLFAVVALPIRERPAWLWIADGLKRPGFGSDSSEGESDHAQEVRPAVA